MSLPDRPFSEMPSQVENTTSATGYAASLFGPTGGATGGAQTDAIGIIDALQQAGVAAGAEVAHKDDAEDHAFNTLSYGFDDIETSGDDDDAAHHEDPVGAMPEPHTAASTDLSAAEAQPSSQYVGAPGRLPLRQDVEVPAMTLGRSRRGDCKRPEGSVSPRSIPPDGGFHIGSLYMDRMMARWLKGRPAGEPSRGGNSDFWDVFPFETAFESVRRTGTYSENTLDLWQHHFADHQAKEFAATKGASVVTALAGDATLVCSHFGPTDPQLFAPVFGVDTTMQRPFWMWPATAQPPQRQSPGPDAQMRKREQQQSAPTAFKIEATNEAGNTRGGRTAGTHARASAGTRATRHQYPAGGDYTGMQQASYGYDGGFYGMMGADAMVAGGGIVVDGGAEEAMGGLTAMMNPEAMPFVYPGARPTNDDMTRRASEDYMAEYGASDAAAFDVSVGRDPTLLNLPPLQEQQWEVVGGQPMPVAIQPDNGHPSPEEHCHRVVHTPPGTTDVQLGLYYYECYYCTYDVHCGRLDARDPDLKLGGVCGDVSPNAIAHMLHCITDINIVAIDVYGKNFGRCNLWLENPSLAPLLASRVNTGLWMAPSHHGYAVYAADEASRRHLVWYLECLKRGPKKVRFPRHMVTAEKWTPADSNGV